METKMERGRTINIIKEARLCEIDLARKSLQKFVSYTKKDYDFQWFHKLVCTYLDALYRGDIKKLMIFIPPQHGKSELSSRRFPAYVLGRDPNTKIAVASYSSELSMGFNKDCQNIIDNELYADVFPKTKLSSLGVRDDTRSVRNAHKFEIVGGDGFFKSVGVKGALTGSSVDIGIIDDPFKDRAEANSITTRNSVWDWYQDVFLTRLHNDSKQLLLFTRWHEDDIAGRILNPKNPKYDSEEAKEWTVIALPALKEANKPLKQAITVNDPREIDEALWESKHSKKKYIKRKRINPTGFQSLDQQRPTAEDGNKIRREWLQIIDESELPFSIDSVAADYFIDGAFTEKTKNDETGLLSCHFDKAKGHLYIFDCSGVRKELYELLIYFKKYVLQNGYKPKSSVYIELKASGHPLKSMFSKMEYGGFNTRAIDDKTVALGKFNRVENAEPFLAGGKVFIVKGHWNAPFVDQCASFPNGVHDDMVDVLAYAIDRYFIRKEAGGVSYE